MLRPEDEEGASLSSFLLFADVFASFTLCAFTGRLISCAPEVFADCWLAGVRRVDRCKGNSDGGDPSGWGLR